MYGKAVIRALVAISAALPAAQALAQTYNFKQIVLNKADSTVILAINNANTMLARDIPTSGPPISILIKSSSQTVISDPSAVNGTYATDLNDAGQVVGYYEDGSNTAIGFVYSNGTYTDFLPPGGMTGLLPTAISNAGTIAGYYYDSAGAHDFVLKGTNLTTFQISGMSYIFPDGINKSEQIAIQAIDGSGHYHAFLKHHASLNELLYPGASDTILQHINDQGQTVGSYHDSAGVLHGFAYDSTNATYVGIDDPGKATTALDGINNKQTITGSVRNTANGKRIGIKATGSLQ